MPTQVYKNKAGKRKPSVTTILKELGDGSEGLMYWAWQKGMDGISLNDARESVTTPGTLAHGLAECDIKGRPTLLPGEMRAQGNDPEHVRIAYASFQAYLDWKAQTRLKLVASEVPLVSEVLGVGGTLDALATFDNTLALIDFKSAKRLYLKTVAQIAAYSDLWDEHHPEYKVTRWACLRWGPDGDFAYHNIPEEWIRRGRIIFRACLTIHEAKSGIRL